MEVEGCCMGKPTGFMEFKPAGTDALPVAERIHIYKEFLPILPDSEMSQQGARCMDCGIPFCHTGCPVNNIIPDWNDLVYKGAGARRWRCCTPPTISRSSPAASVRHRARRRAR